MYVLKFVSYKYRKTVETSESLALFNVTNTGEFFPTHSSDLVDSWRERPRLSKEKDVQFVVIAKFALKPIRSARRSTLPLPGGA